MLTPNQQYYVRVYAKNTAGLGNPIVSSPPAARPVLSVPGTPIQIIASTGATTGTVSVHWLLPSVPWHNYPCSGFTNNVGTCPSPLGGGSPATDGGSPITEYLVAYNEQPDFSGLDRGEQTTTALVLTLNNLTPGRLYYVRVLARNAQGSGSFCEYSDANNCLLQVTQAQAYAHT